jgi:predicted outer membrane lipoprotein
MRETTKDMLTDMVMVIGISLAVALGTLSALWYLNLPVVQKSTAMCECPCTIRKYTRRI